MQERIKYRVTLYHSGIVNKLTHFIKEIGTSFLLYKSGYIFSMKFIPKFT